MRTIPVQCRQPTTTLPLRKNYPHAHRLQHLYHRLPHLRIQPISHTTRKIKPHSQIQPLPPVTPSHSHSSPHSRHDPSTASKPAPANYASAPTPPHTPPPQNHDGTSFLLHATGSKSLRPLSTRAEPSRERRTSQRTSPILHRSRLACDDNVELVRMFGDITVLQRALHTRLDPILASHACHRNVFSAGQRRIEDAAQLARCLRESGDLVQLICPDYGTHVAEPNVHSVPSVVLPFYRELHLPRPPFGPVCTCGRRVSPRHHAYRDRGDAGRGASSFWPNTRLAGGFEFSHEFRPVQRSLRSGLGEGVDLAYLRLFHNSTRETYVPSSTTISELETMGFERLKLWRRGVDSDVFRPDRPGGMTCGRRWAGHGTTWSLRM